MMFYFEIKKFFSRKYIFYLEMSGKIIIFAAEIDMMEVSIFYRAD